MEQDPGVKIIVALERSAELGTNVTLTPAQAAWVVDELAQLKHQRKVLASALRGLMAAVAFDLRHGDDDDEDTAWRCLEAIKTAMEQANRALIKYDEFPQLPEADHAAD